MAAGASLLQPGSPTPQGPVRVATEHPSSPGAVVWARSSPGWWPAVVRQAAEPAARAALTHRGELLVCFLGDAALCYACPEASVEPFSGAPADPHLPRPGRQLKRPLKRAIKLAKALQARLQARL